MGYCIIVACYFINILPYSILAKRTPFEALHGKHADYRHLQTLGCLCFALVLPYSDKFASRAKPTVFLGYSVNQKGYIVMTLYDFVVHTKRDVVFHEHIFPFQMDKHELFKLIPHICTARDNAVNFVEDPGPIQGLSNVENNATIAENDVAENVAEVDAHAKTEPDEAISEQAEPEPD